MQRWPRSNVFIFGGIDMPIRRRGYAIIGGGAALLALSAIATVIAAELTARMTYDRQTHRREVQAGSTA